MREDKATNYDEATQVWTIYIILFQCRDLIFIAVSTTYGKSFYSRHSLDKKEGASFHRSSLFLIYLSVF
jgi:hypothetical protein